MRDADETLERFLVDGDPHPPAFHGLIAGLLQDAAPSGGPVRVYGEMVAVLWEQGNVSAAMGLEDLWNEVAAARPFGLLCGYPSVLFSHPGSSRPFESLCDRHTVVTVPPEQDLTRWASRAVPADRPGEREVRWRFPAELTSGARARAELRELLTAWRLPALLDETMLLATELINNSVVHARSPVLVGAKHGPDALRVEVTDVGAGVVRRPVTGLDDTHGRGLLLVDAMSSAWGIANHGGSKTVWFELRTPLARVTNRVSALPG